MSPVWSQPSSSIASPSCRAGCGSPSSRTGRGSAPRRRRRARSPTPGAGGPDGADLDLVGRVAGAVAGRLRHAPQLGQRDARSRGRTRSPRAASARRRRSPTPPASRPSRPRIFESTSSSALAYSSPSGTSSPLLGLPRGPRRAPTSWPASSLVLLGLDAGLDTRPSASPRCAAPRRTRSAAPRAGTPRPGAGRGSRWSRSPRTSAGSACRRARRCAPSAGRRPRGPRPGS